MTKETWRGQEAGTAVGKQWTDTRYHRKGKWNSDILPPFPHICPVVVERHRWRSENERGLCVNTGVWMYMFRWGRDQAPLCLIIKLGHNKNKSNYFPMFSIISVKQCNRRLGSILGPASCWEWRLAEPSLRAGLHYWDWEILVHWRLLVDRRGHHPWGGVWGL